jgi:phosphoglycerol transferase MdoB-like AlkP superfamily enzyme
MMWAAAAAFNDICILIITPGKPSTVNTLLSQMKPYGLLTMKVVRSRYVALSAFLFAYTWIMSLLGGMPPLRHFCRLEIPLLLGVYYYLNHLTRPSKWQALITAIPIILIYAVFDMVFLQFGRLLRVIEIKELPELMGVLPFWAIVAVIIFAGSACTVFLRSMRFKMDRPTIIGASLILGLILTVELKPDSFLYAFEKVQRSVTMWSDIQSAEDNGRIWTMMYSEAKRKSNALKMVDFKADPAFLKKMDEKVSMINSLKKKRNVHLVVLESFIDPTLFKGISLSKSPVHPDFDKIFKNKGSISISPVFGGGTAQAEFEILSGVPAFGKFSGMEFDVFTGAGTFCLPAILNRAGYNTMASNAFKPDFFNSINAYKGAGFQSSYYPKEYAKGRETYISTGDVTDERYMFDGELLQQNLDYITQWKKNNPEVPLFNYIMSIYGHYPYQMNTKKRPLIIDVKGAIKDGFLEHSVNQYYYRTQALAQFVLGIKKVDPESVVILISDHLPGLYGPNTYEKLNYADGNKDQLHMNRVFFFENGKAIHYDTLHHYDIPDIILNYLSNGSYCNTQDCKFKTPAKDVSGEGYDEAYMTILANAMK